MSTAQEIVDQAYRENNLIPVGDSPTPAERTEGLAVLNRFLTGLFGHELSEKLENWHVPQPARTSTFGSRYPQGPAITATLTSEQVRNPPPNSRIIGNITESTTIYFPEAPSDGARMMYVEIGKTGTLTLDGNGYTIEAAATVTDPTSGTEWFFRADTGNWVELASLALGDDMPLPAAFDDLSICGTNIRLCPRHGKEPMASTIAAYRAQLGKASSRYAQEREWVGGADEIVLSSQSNNYNPLA